MLKQDLHILEGFKNQSVNYLADQVLCTTKKKKIKNEYLHIS